MSNKKQTAIELVFEYYDELFPFPNNGMLKELKDKKAELIELEKQQICESFAHGYLDFENTGRAMEVAEKYYNETYEQ